jgi:CDGSH-type Zn-finger protein
MGTQETGTATRITVVENGPLVVKGAIALVDRDGNAYETRPTVFLRRCGQSATKPFCDDSQVCTGFKAPDRAGSTS